MVYQNFLNTFLFFRLISLTNFVNDTIGLFFYGFNVNGSIVLFYFKTFSVLSL